MSEPKSPKPIEIREPCVYCNDEFKNSYNEQSSPFIYNKKEYELCNYCYRFIRNQIKKDCTNFYYAKNRSIFKIDQCKVCGNDLSGFINYSDGKEIYIFGLMDLRFYYCCIPCMDKLFKKYKEYIQIELMTKL